MSNTKSFIVQIRRATSTRWEELSQGQSPLIPKSGEIIYYTDIKKIKIGDGINSASNLPFFDQDFINFNLENNFSTGSVQSKKDGSGTTIDWRQKNPNAILIDPSLATDLPYGASGVFAVSLNGSSMAMGKRAFAHGTNTVAKGKYSTAEGDSTAALGISSHAEGYRTTAGTYDSTGNNVNSAHAEGFGTVASGLSSHAEGKNNTASGEESHAEGYETTAAGEYAHAEGYGSIAASAAAASHAEGRSTNASGSYSHSEGYGSSVSGTAAHAEGHQTSASGNYSHAEGLSSSAQGSASHAEGSGTTASGSNGSHAEGASSIASGDSSHAEGYGCTASGENSHAGGRGTVAGNYAQAAFGKWNNNQSNSLFEIGNGGDSSNRSNAFAVFLDGHAELASAGGTNNSILRKVDGDSNYLGTQNPSGSGSLSLNRLSGTLVGRNSVVVGSQNIASGTNTFATGSSNVAYGDESHAEGYGCEARGSNSHADGRGTLAGNYAQTAIGMWNNNQSDSLFEVGNGTSDTNRSNAFAVFLDGHAEIGSMGNTNLSVTTKKYVDDAIDAKSPSSYLKSASVSGNTLTLTKKDDTTVEFAPNGTVVIESTAYSLVHETQIANSIAFNNGVVIPNKTVYLGDYQTLDFYLSMSDFADFEVNDEFTFFVACKSITIAASPNIAEIVDTSTLPSSASYVEVNIKVGQYKSVKVASVLVNVKPIPTEP